MDIAQMQQISEQYGLGSSLASSIDIKAIIAMIFFSTMGIWYYRWGKRENDILRLLCGIALFLYGYFIYDFIYLMIIGTILVALPYLRNLFRI